MTEVLIVEDLKETRTWLAEIARAAFPDCQVVEASSVREAIVRLDATRVDIALIDLGLPDGSGLDVLRRLRHDQPQATCIVTTVMAFDAIETVELARRFAYQITFVPRKGPWSFSANFASRSAASEVLAALSSRGVPLAASAGQFLGEMQS
ncbi:MAG TPA: response regulator [Devosia sp.]|jgi:CheY-like chemotaxis protein|uniref:response regulator n=1 Tax=Devosia sp. TaxID=1871048 RepID=UPI002DDCF298|nr:response regulator [Devosia sp.]HEV2516601.1 response regulator [Devosia sp.]